MRTLCGVVTGLLLAAAASAQTTWTVDDDGGADFTEIQDAIDASSDGDTVLVFPGTYLGFDLLGKAIDVRSDAGASETVIESRELRPPLSTQDGVTGTAVIEGFLFRLLPHPDNPSGWIDNSSVIIESCEFRSDEWVIGSGFIQVDDSFLEMRACRFVECDAAGELFSSHDSDLRLIDCEFTRNNSSHGAVSVRRGSALMQGCRFVQNTARSSAAAVVAQQSASIILEGCEFRENEAPDQFNGGAVESFSGTVVATDCVFAGNHAGSGGAIYSSGELTLTRCQFYDNSSLVFGGAVEQFDPRLIAADCVFVGNAAAVDGGAVYLHGGLSVIERCQFVRNVANWGGAVYGPVELTSCTFTENRAIVSGGAVDARSDVWAEKCQFDGNSSGEDGGALRISDGALVLESCRVLDNSAGGLGSGVVLRRADARFAHTWICGNLEDQVVGDWQDDGGNCVTDDCNDCECVADWDGNGVVDTRDVIKFLGAWSADDPAADLNGDGEVNTIDVVLFLDAWAAGC